MSHSHLHGPSSPLSCTSVLAARMLHRALSRSESWLLARTQARTQARRHARTHARALNRSPLLRRRRHLTSYGTCSTVSLRRVVEENVAGHHTCHACEERLSVCRLLLVHIMAGHERIEMLDTRSSIVNEHLGPFRCALLSTNKMSTEHLRYLCFGVHRGPWNSRALGTRILRLNYMYVVCQCG